MEGDGKEEEEEERARAVRLRRLVQFTPGGFPPVSFALCLSQEVEEGWFRGASEPRSCHRRSFTDVNRGRVPRGVLSILCIAEQSRPTPRYTPMYTRACVYIYIFLHPLAALPWREPGRLKRGEPGRGEHARTPPAALPAPCFTLPSPYPSPTSFRALWGCKCNPR